MGAYSIHVVGESFKNDDGSDRQKIIAGLNRSTHPVELRREPDNPYDEDAVAVFVHGKQVGYIPKNKAWVARILHEGKKIRAEVEKVIGGQKIGLFKRASYGVVITVYTGPDV